MSKKSTEMVIVWHGRVLQLDIEIDPPDYDTGIEGPGVAKLKVTDAITSEEVLLTEEEFQELASHPEVIEKVEWSYYGLDKA